MSILMMISCVLMSVMTSLTSPVNDDLPKTWLKDFTITLSYSGSMDGSNTNITFTFDSCKYVGNRGMEAQTKTYYIMTEKDRVDILNKLHALEVNKIKSEISITPVDDGWSQLMCFGTHCINGGTSATMSDNDQSVFSEAYAYLESFAIAKAKKKLK